MERSPDPFSHSRHSRKEIPCKAIMFFCACVSAPCPAESLMQLCQTRGIRRGHEILPSYHRQSDIDRLQIKTSSAQQQLLKKGPCDQEPPASPAVKTASKLIYRCAVLQDNVCQSRHDGPVTPGFSSNTQEVGEGAHAFCAHSKGQRRGDVNNGIFIYLYCTRQACP